MRMAARIIAGLLALLGILVAAGGGVLFLNDVQESTALLEETRPIVGDLAEEDQAELDVILAQQTNTAYALFGVSVLALIAAILAFMGRGLVAAPLLLIAGVAPYAARPEGGIFLFTGTFILAGVIALFARRKPKDKEPAAQSPAAA